ncbi:YxcD family protein [Paenibacillus taiwanensis]|uniref:YxcD family protein n=1 Tax=Paenibacillus taiwanensis TaxID=401638 RepID=UPI0003F7E39B|nr:YxcD family protein [Paenibacillus taiwanensis]
MNLTLTMDEIVNAICLNMAMRRQVQPSEIEVELCWDEEHGFSAQVWVQGRHQYIVESNMLEALEQYVYNNHGQRVFRSQIQLQVNDEDMWADVQLN